MRLKNKMIISASLLSAVPIIIASLFISLAASNNSEKTLEQSAKARLISVRDITKERIEEYFETIHKQVNTLSTNLMTVEAAREFTIGFQSYRREVPSASVQNKNTLRNYYRAEFNAEYKQRNNQIGAPVDQWLNALDEDSLALQTQMIANNPHPLGEKHNLNQLNDDSRYGRAHTKYHPYIRSFLEEFGYYDIFLVDASSGDIVYSVFKELDYSTSLFDGPFANTGIGLVFRKALKLSAGSAIEDFAPYSPSYEDPASFIASPIVDNGETIAVLIFQMPINKINDIMTYKRNWQSTGLGNSGESYLVGADGNMRTLSRFLIEDQSGYLAALKAANVDPGIIRTIETKNTSIGLQPVDSLGLRKAISGTTGFDTFEDYRKIPVLSAYAPLEITGLQWAILTEIDESEAFEPARILRSDIAFIAVVVTIVLGSLATLVGVWFSNRITAPVLGLSQTLSTVQQELNLTKRAERSSSDEIGAAAKAFNAMMDEIHDGMEQVACSAKTIAAASEQTSVTCVESQKHISRQQESTEQVSAAMEQMIMSLREVTAHISQSVIAADAAQRETDVGSELVTKNVASIKSFADQITSVADAINNLEKDSESIDDIVDVISSVAEQTNLLALNAAIEAARAGEQGRGFAVVADEVRTLAGRTGTATEEIKQMVERLQSGAHQSVELMNASKAQIEVLVNQALKAGETLVNIAQMMTHINTMSRQISSATEEQATVTEEINQQLVTINDMAGQTSIGAEQTAQASNSLAQQAKQMTSLVERFRI